MAKTKIDSRLLMRQLLWLITHRRRFLRDFQRRLEPDFFASPEARYLVRTALLHFNTTGKALKKSILIHYVEEDDDRGDLEEQGITAKSVMRLYSRLEAVEDDELDYMWTKADEFCRHQALNLGIVGAAEALEDGDIEEAWRIINGTRVTQEGSTTKSLRVFADWEEVIDRIGEREASVDYVSTGLRRLDAILGGGVKRGELAVYCAPSGSGKTMWLCFVAAMATLMGAEVAYYTLEVDQDEIWLRTTASMSGIPITETREDAASSTSDPDYKRSMVEGEDIRDRLKKFRKRMRRLGMKTRDIWVRDMPPRYADINSILADLDEIKQQGGNPSLVVIDYADRLRARGRHEKRWEGQEEVYIDLASIAKERDIAIWTASQVGRQALKKRNITMELIAGAFSKVFEASLVIAGGQTDDMRKHSWFNFFIAKTRRSSGSGNSMLVGYDFSKSQFKTLIRSSDLDDEDDLGEATSMVDDEAFEDEED